METVSFSDFKKIELKVAHILAVEDIEGKDKLYKLQIDIGEEHPRILVAGLKPFYTKDELNGKQIIVVANLEPKPLAGILSHGMLLASGPKEGPVSLLTLDKEMPAGSKVE
ncbi:MAG: hypothetical protein V1777_00255 [Candidatus Micrarchaeota archaeon]